MILDLILITFSLIVFELLIITSLILLGFVFEAYYTKAQILMETICQMSNNQTTAYDTDDY